MVPERKKKRKRGPQVILTQEQWDKIRVEWEAGTDLGLVVREYGTDESGASITTQAIYVRAKREAWPQRPKGTAVTDRVTKTVRESDSGSNSLMFAATSLNRVLSLMIRHRTVARRLINQLTQCMDRIEEYRRELGDRKTTLKQEQMIMTITARAAETLARLIPIERKAIGLTDEDGASEFDMLTDQELAALEALVRKFRETVRGRELPPPDSE